MEGVEELKALLCGDGDQVASEADCEFGKILSHLRIMISSTMTELEWLGSQPTDRISFYGPYLGRTLLELAVTAIAGRLDPTRLLVIKRTQEHNDYSTQKPWKSAIRWQGDVVDSAVKNLWADGVAYRDMTKALFGDYYGALYWSMAMERLIDIEANGTGAWLAQLRAITYEQFIRTRRELVNALYSSTSKGIHNEFVVPPGSLYDKATIIDHINKIVQSLAEFGLLVNMLPHVSYRLKVNIAMDHFDKIEKLEVIK